MNWSTKDKSEVEHAQELQAKICQNWEKQLQAKIYQSGEIEFYHAALIPLFSNCQF